MRFSLAAALALSVVGSSCFGLGVGPDSSSTSTSDGGNGNTASTGCKSIPAVRTMSESCCADYGVDACGAGLFCAAFDGRTIATCYPLHSRASLDTCTADNQCQSGSCNLTTGRCRGGAYDACTPATGCREANRSCIAVCPGYTNCTTSCSQPCVPQCA